MTRTKMASILNKIFKIVHYRLFLDYIDYELVYLNLQTRRQAANRYVMLRKIDGFPRWSRVSKLRVENRIFKINVETFFGCYIFRVRAQLISQLRKFFDIGQPAPKIGGKSRRCRLHRSIDSVGFSSYSRHSFFVFGLSRLTSGRNNDRRKTRGRCDDSLRGFWFQQHRRISDSR